MTPYPLDDARSAFLDALDGLSALLDHLADEQHGDDRMHARSRCRGWLVADVLAHLHLGLVEMLAGFPARTDRPADTTFASYWAAFPPGGEEPDWAHVRFARGIAAAYARPSAQVIHVRTTVRGLRRLVADLSGRHRIEFQGHVLEVSDFVAPWVVEVVVHHLDMTVDLSGAPEPPASGLAVVRETVAALLPDPVALDGRDDTSVALVATGRVPDPGLGAVLG